MIIPSETQLTTLGLFRHAGNHLINDSINRSRSKWPLKRRNDRPKRFLFLPQKASNENGSLCPEKGKKPAREQLPSIGIADMQMQGWQPVDIYLNQIAETRSQPLVVTSRDRRRRRPTKLINRRENGALRRFDREYRMRVPSSPPPPRTTPRVSHQTGGAGSGPRNCGVILSPPPPAARSRGRFHFNAAPEFSGAPQRARVI